MIDMERIEKAYLRFKVLHDSLVFRIYEVKSDGKDQHGKEISTTNEPQWEVRCGARQIFKAIGENARNEAKEIAAELNLCLEPFMTNRYNKFLDEVIVSKHLVESSN